MTIKTDVIRLTASIRHSSGKPLTAEDMEYITDQIMELCEKEIMAAVVSATLTSDDEK